MHAPLLPLGDLLKTNRLRVALAVVAAGCTTMWAAPLTVDLSTREQSRQFYRSIYAGSAGVPMGFTGDVAALRAGDTSAAFKEAVRLRVNFFRAFAGLSGEIQFNAAFNAKCQQAALLASLNTTITHTPPSSARGYTADAAEAAGKSNLSLASTGPDAVTNYYNVSLKALQTV